ncbi:hypothetical protein [Niabella hirudinis]|uniref:hypothetical protein n=1 Tax=Niabella hirudinis TaxID=1285929 RepID=UPI003EBE6BD4
MRKKNSFSLVFTTAIVATTLLTSCLKAKQLTFPGYFRNPPKCDTALLKFDGFYSVIDTSILPSGERTQGVFTSIYPVTFTKNNKVYIISGNTAVGYPSVRCDTYVNVNNADIGRYYIQNNEIIAFALVTLAMKGGSYFSRYWLHFKGEIKNRDTIVNWRAVSPFPDKVGKTEINDEQNRRIFKPNQLHFQENSAVKCLKDN